MSFTEFKRVIHMYDAKTRETLLKYMTKWAKHPENVTSVLKDIGVKNDIKNDIKHTAIKKKKRNPKRNKRKQIPKMIRGKVWEQYHGTSLMGDCYCCKREMHAFDAWHVGHIIPHAHGGSDTVSNLRPLCASCNTSMGTQNMDEFKAQYYS